MKGMRYFITFACYRSHVHGAEPGFVDRRHNVPGTRTLDADSKRAAVESEAMKQPPYLLDERARTVMETARRKNFERFQVICQPCAESHRGR
jgi:hypothetical protein